jgi:gliding motility-associated-like protein
LWNNGSTNKTQVISSSGLYWLKLYRDGCSYTDSINVKIHPPFDFDVITENRLCSETNESAILKVTDDKFSYYWLPGEDTSKSVVVNEEGLYSVTAVNADGCSSTKTVFVKNQCPFRIFIPNAFSPDKNSINDIFLPVVSFAEEYELRIFNRWGENIFTTNDKSEGWNGYYNGIKAIPGSYAYKIISKGFNKAGYLDNFYFHGFITLK